MHSRCLQQVAFQNDSIRHSIKSLVAIEQTPYLKALFFKINKVTCNVATSFHWKATRLFEALKCLFPQYKSIDWTLSHNIIGGVSYDFMSFAALETLYLKQFSKRSLLLVPFVSKHWKVI